MLQLFTWLFNFFISQWSAIFLVSDGTTGHPWKCWSVCHLIQLNWWKVCVICQASSKEQSLFNIIGLSLVYMCRRLCLLLMAFDIVKNNQSTQELRQTYNVTGSANNNHYWCILCTYIPKLHFIQPLFFVTNLLFQLIEF